MLEYLLLGAFQVLKPWPLEYSFLCRKYIRVSNKALLSIPASPEVYFKLIVFKHKMTRRISPNCSATLYHNHHFTYA